MKKLMFFIILVVCMGSCTQTFDNIKNFATEETVYPGRFDTIYGNVGFERIELDLLKAGRLPANKINLGKAKNTIVEYDGKKLEFDSVCSWVSVKGLTQPKLYRFSVYTTDEFGNKSVPQEIAMVPFTSADAENLSVASPRVIASPWAVSLSWTKLSSVLLDYIDLTYRWTDKNGTLKTGECKENPRISMENLEAGKEASLDIRYRIIPKVENVAILDTMYLDRTFSLYMPTSEEYQEALTSRGIRSLICTMSGDIQISWLPVDDYTLQHTKIRYNDGVDRVVEVANEENTTVLTGCKVGVPFYISSNYKPEGVDGVYIDSKEKEYNLENLDYIRTEWNTVYTSVQPATDGFPDGPTGVSAWNAQIDGNIRSMLSMAKPGKSVNGSTNPQNGTLYFVLDLQTSAYIDYFRILNRTTDTGDGLKIWAVQLYGTNTYQGPMNKYSNPGPEPDVDDTNWEPIGQVIALVAPRPLETANIRLPRGYYRYVKVRYMDWSTTANSACQLAEFYLGVHKDPLIIN